MHGATAPRISIVMPTMNQAGFITESVASVMSQDVDGLELVISDGGSTDGTLGELAALAARYPGRMRWASAPDAGPADAVNAAVARSRAPIIGWLNSDDLYAPGAVRRALAHLDAHPDHVMVYGEAEHVDERGARIERYPSRGPDTPLAAYADGCHVCQPSAFFRREAFDSLGGLDRTLRASFDYDLWLRLFKAFPGRYGFVSQVQARSRLHAGAITMRMREQVALEGIEVVSRHLGTAPVHWLLTYANELVAEHPFRTPGGDLAEHLRAVLGRVAGKLGADAPAELEAFLAGHQAVQMSSACVGASLHADGWAPPVFDLRVHQPSPAEPAVTMARLHCRHASPASGSLHVSIATPEEGVWTLEVPRRGPFVVELPVQDRRPGARLVFRLTTEAGDFVPAQVERGSSDERRLAFRVEGIELVTPRA